MREFLRPIIRGLLLALVSAQWGAQPVNAQNAAPLIKASWATNYARYYAPYALQAAAAYLSVPSFDGTLGAQGEPPLDGADLTLAVSPYTADSETTSRARNALKIWQYQFGSDSYLSCLDPSDAECQKVYGGSWRLSISGGPAFQVWARTHFPHTAHDSCNEVSIAFRGTQGNFSDILSNGDQVFGSTVDDYYHQLQRNIDAIIRKITSLDCYKRARSRPQIVSVGHSLGGGLAQLAALANNPAGPRIAKVFAFDTSPVTAANIVPPNIRYANANGLTIDRIRQNGEVLSRFLRIDQQYPPSNSGCNPLVRTVEFDALPASSPIQLHSMAGLAAQVGQLSYNANTELALIPPPATNCATRYHPPGSDEEGTPVAKLGPDRTLAASSGSGTAMQNSQYGPIYPITVEQTVSTATPTKVRAHRIVWTTAVMRKRQPTQTASF